MKAGRLEDGKLGDGGDGKRRLDDQEILIYIILWYILVQKYSVGG